MIRYTTGNLLESDAECLVNTVNCEGFMGKGIAYQFKQRYPQNNKDYIRACRSGELHIGALHYFEENGKLIVNFPTKDKWREKSRMYYVEDGLELLANLIIDRSLASIALPPLGCGNGGLAWSDVKRTINSKLSSVEDKCLITVFEPSKSYKAVIKEPPRISISAIALLLIQQGLNRFDSVRLQKTGYFVDYYLGYDYFKYRKWKYGPYSYSVNLIAKKIGEYQEYYGLRSSATTIEKLYNEICSKKIDDKIKELKLAVESATLFVNNINTNKDLEGISTALYIITNSSGLSEQQIVAEFKSWSEDKAKRFTEEKIQDYIFCLQENGIVMKNIVGLYETVERYW